MTLGRLQNHHFGWGVEYELDIDSAITMMFRDDRIKLFLFSSKLK
jgi:hypothetical protein